MNLFKKLYNKFFKRKYANSFTITGRGLYMFSYIARKYMNGEDVDEIETYEEDINHFTKYLDDKGYFEYLQQRIPQHQINDLTKHVWTANVIASIIYKSIIEEDKKKCRDMINEGELKQAFLKAQNSQTFNF